MDQTRSNQKAIVTYGLPANLTQQKIKEAIIESENLVSDSADDQIIHVEAAMAPIHTRK